MNTSQTGPDISIVIPLYNEAESLPDLIFWIHRTLQGKFSYNVWLIDDGSQDNSWEVIKQLKHQYPSLIHAIRFRRNYGKSAALQVGFSHADGKVVITMDADLQDSPEEIPALYRMITEENYDLVSGWKKKRYDPLSKTLPTKLFNWATRKMSGIPLHDFNCGLKAYKAEVIKSIEVYGEMHRYIPVIAKWAGFTKIGEKIVVHQARKYGKSKFGIERFLNGFLDLLSIAFVTRFGKKPMHLFGGIGTAVFIIGFIMVIILATEKLYYLLHKIPARLITDKPLFYIALVCMILGTQLFLAGFLGELISRNGPERNQYLIKEKL